MPPFIEAGRRRASARLAGVSPGTEPGAHSVDTGNCRRMPKSRWILPEPELHLGADVVVPDLAGWRKEALPRLPEIAYFRLAPAWLCEVLSASTETLDRGKKMATFARHGVRDVWFIDPADRTLEAFANDGGVFCPAGTFRGSARVRVPPF